jgi:hypothetical protein
VRRKTMRAQILAQGEPTGYNVHAVQPFGYRSDAKIRRTKLTGTFFLVVLPIIFNAVVGLI